MSYRYGGTIRDMVGDAQATVNVTIYTDDAGSVTATGMTDFDGNALSNPTATDARGRLQIVHYAPALYYKVAGDTLVQPLPPLGQEALDDGVLNIKDYGATGDGVTDDTAAIQAAIDYAEAQHYVSWESKDCARYLIEFPAGDYLVTGLTIQGTRGISLRGAGKVFTRILSGTPAPIFRIGAAMETEPAGSFVGSTSQGASFSDMTLTNPDETTYAALEAESQVTTGIQDNGCGGINLTNVEFDGLLYGIFAPYGHDYCRYINCDFNLCSNAIYWGPGSQQVHLWGCTFTICDRSIVMEYGLQGSVNSCTFNDPRTRDIDILAPAVLESGVDPDFVQAGAGDFGWSFNDCWFETGSYGQGWGPTEHVRIGQVGDPYVVSGITFRNAYLVSGSVGMGVKDGGTTYAFLNVQLGQGIVIDRITVSGAYIDAVVTHPAASYQNILVRDYRMMSPWTDVPVFDPWEVNNQAVSYETGAEVRTVADGTVVPQQLIASTGNGIRIGGDGYNIDFEGLQSSVWYKRMRLAVGADRLYIGPVGTSENSIEWAAAAPTSGDYRVGDIIFDTGATSSGKVGWVCTTAGTAGSGAVFKEFGPIGSDYSLDGLIVNEAGTSTGDLRAESDTESNMLFLDASADKLYIGGTTNGITVDKGGNLKLNGTATQWEDLRVEPHAKGTGANNPAFEKWLDDVAGTSIGVWLYSFPDNSAGQEKEVFFTMQMPHAWAQTDIHFHVHWMGNVADTTSTPRWGLEYAWVKPNGTFGDTTIIYAVGNEGSDPDTTAYKHYITDFADISPGTTANGLSSILIGRLFRDSANGADTYNATNNKCGLLYMDAHYEVDSFGSAAEYTK